MSLQFSIPYLLLLFSFTVLLFIEFQLINKNKSILAIRWFVIVVYLAFFGLRGFVFSDWSIYYPLFNKIPTIWDSANLNSFDFSFTDDFTSNAQAGKSGMEKGFILFVYLFKSIIPNYHAFLFFNVLIDVFFLNYFIKRYSPYYTLSFILFLTFGGILIECDLLRNIKAILLFLYSLKYLENRKIIPYMLINAFGILFHSTAAIFLPLYFFLHKEFPKWLIWAIFIVGNIIFLLKISYIQPLILYIADAIGGRLAVQVRLYLILEDYNSAYGISLGYIERIITYSLILFNYQKLKQQNRSNLIFINAYILYFFIFFFLSEISIAVNRLTLLFSFSYWIFYPKIYENIKSLNLKMVVISLFLTFSSLKIALLTQDIFTKYDNLLFGIESYDNRRDTFDNYSKPVKNR